MAAYGIVFLLFLTILATELAPVATDQISLVGQPCDPDLFEKVIRPMADVHERILLEHYRDVNPVHVNATTDLLTQMLMTLNKTLKAERPGHELENLATTQGCNGFQEPYMTCDPATRLCACKNKFPFNNTSDGKNCYPQPGSVCAISICRIANDYVLNCVGGLICKGYGIGDKSGYCGGLYEFDKYRSARLAELNKNLTQSEFDLHDHTTADSKGSKVQVSWALIILIVHMVVATY